jgi:hypothetical protein
MKTLILKHLAAVIVCTVGVVGIAAGQSTAEDSNGDAVVFVPSGALAGGVFSANTESSSVRLSFLRRTTAPMYYGFEVSGKANNGVASLFQGQDIAPGATFAVNVGRHSIGIDRREGGDFNWLNVHLAYEVSRLVFFDKSAAFSNQIARSTVSSPELLISYGHLWQGSVLIVGSVGVARQHNYDDLAPVKVNQTEVLAGPSGITRTITSEINARAGMLAQSTAGLARLDGLILPGMADNRLGIALYSETGFADDLERGTVIGGGLHLLKKNQPSQSIAGVIVEVADAFGAHTDANQRRTLRVFIQAGVPFSFSGRP